MSNLHKKKCVSIHLFQKVYEQNWKCKKLRGEIATILKYYSFSYVDILLLWYKGLWMEHYCHLVLVLMNQQLEGCINSNFSGEKNYKLTFYKVIITLQSKQAHSFLNKRLELAWKQHGSHLTHRGHQYLSCDRPETPRWHEVSSAEHPDSQNAAASPQTTNTHTQKNIRSLVRAYFPSFFCLFFLSLSLILISLNFFLPCLYFVCLPIISTSSFLFLPLVCPELNFCYLLLYISFSSILPYSLKFLHSFLLPSWDLVLFLSFTCVLPPSLTASDSSILMVILLTASAALLTILRSPALLRAWVLTARGN